ncbi:MAG: hypothetical protein BGO69_03085 [Bacteroidetes bacterium 46-16]|nr:MAG: hypothetical protein BGO69_03085 [Bacteroidetes bacterium 46-16]
MTDQVLPYNSKWLLRVYLAIVFFSTIVCIITGSYLAFFAPLVLLYLVTFSLSWKLAYWMLLFSIPFSVLFTLQGDTLSISLPDEPMMWAFLLLLPVLFANKPGIIYKWWLKDPLVIVVLLQLIWLFVAVLHSRVFFLSAKFLVAKVWYLACFFVFPIWVFRNKKDFKKGFWLMLASMLATVVVVLFRQLHAHFSFITINRDIGALYNNHVEYSSVLSMFLPLVFIAYLICPPRKKWIKRALLAITLVFLIAVFFSYARAAVLAVIFSAIVGLAIRFRLVNVIMPCIYGIITLLMVYLVQDSNYIDLRPDYEHTYMHTNFKGHILATFKGQDMSSMERIYRWIAAIRMSRDEPVLGYGPHSFYYYYKPYTVNTFKTYVSENYEHSTTHNYFLYMLVEQGWPAMILYALLVMLVFAHAQRTYHMAGDRFYKYVTLGLAMAFAASFVNNFFSELIETHKVGALFYLSIALLIILRKKCKDVNMVANIR